MAIQTRRGNYADFVPENMLPGEIATCLDNKYVFVGLNNGQTVQLGTMDAIEEAVEEAEGYATAAGTSATSASGSATTATAKATLSESWAVGGTSSRSGEDTNNSKYYSEQAESYMNNAIYIFIRYSENADGTNFVATPTELTYYIGIYQGHSSTAPSDKTAYSWFKWKGLKGDTGATGPTGPQGDTGATGNGIASVTLVSGSHQPGTSDQYRITFTDATTFDFYVYNGANGTGVGDMLQSVYDADYAVATAGGIADYVNANGGKIDHIKVNGTEQTITNKTVDIAVPTKTSDLTNDGDGTNAFLTQHQSLSAYRTSSAQDVIDATKASASDLEDLEETVSGIAGGDAYSSTTTYAVGDIVIYNNALYKCIATCVGIVPTNTSYWSPISISTINSNLSDLVTMTIVSGTTDSLGLLYLGATNNKIPILVRCGTGLWIQCAIMTMVNNGTYSYAARITDGADLPQASTSVVVQVVWLKV